MPPLGYVPSTRYVPTNGLGNVPPNAQAPLPPASFFDNLNFQPKSPAPTPAVPKVPTGRGYGGNLPRGGGIPRGGSFGSIPPAVGAAGGGFGAAAATAAAAAVAAAALILLTPEPTANEGEALKKAQRKQQENLLNRPEEPPQEVQPPKFSFTGGQGEGIQYYVDVTYSFVGNAQGTVFTSTQTKSVFGKIGGTRSFQSGTSGLGQPIYKIELSCQGEVGTPFGAPRWIKVADTEGLKSHGISKIRRIDGKADTSGNPPPDQLPIYSNPGKTAASPTNYQRTPGGTPAPTPAAPPPARRTSPAPTAAPPQGLSFPDPAPSPYAAPTPVPQPPGDPVTNPPVAPTPSSTPSAVPKPPYLVSPVPSQPIPPTGFAPTPITPTPLKPTTLPPGQPFQPQIITREPVLTPTKPTSPPTTPPPEPSDLDRLKKDLKETFNTIAPALAGITALLNPIAKNTTPDALEAAAAAGTCRTTQPGGCTYNAVNDAANNAVQKGNEDLLGKLSDLANLALLPKIDAKLGEQIPGGIGGKLSRFVNWSIGDRVIGMMSMVASVHNAFMLSNNVGQTLFSILDNLGNIGALIIKPDGVGDIDSKAWVTSNLESLFSTMLGAETWASVKASYRAANNIFSTSSNMYDNLRSIHNDSQELLNMVRRDTAELGNALVEEGVISEDNWDVRDPKIKIKSRVLNRLDNMSRGLEDLDNKLEAIEQLTSTLLNIAQTAKEVSENVDQLGKQLGDANTAFKDTRDKAIEALPDFNFGIDDLY